MKRLLICTPTAVLQGGVERIIESLARDLPSRGFEVIFGLARGARFHDPAKFRAEYPGIPAVELDGTSGSAYGRRRAIQRAIEATKPDIVLAARLYDVYPVLAEMKVHESQVRLAVTIQAYESEYFVDLARYARFVDVCVASGELVAEGVRRFTDLAPRCVRSIPGGVAPPRRRVEHRAGAPLRIGYVGRIEQIQKRIFDLPDFVRELDNRNLPYHLVVAGSGSDLTAIQDRLPATEFLGWQSHEALYDHVYPELDVLVHFASFEGVAIAPREAMVHGVVPVISRFPGVAEERQFIDGENALTFPVGDVRAAADAVERLHRDRGLLERLSWNAGASQQGVYSHDGAIDAWADALRMSLVNPPNLQAQVPRVGTERGRLERAHVPEPVGEWLRRVTGRRFVHQSAGSEWPHWSGEPDAELMQAIDAFGGR